MGLTTLKKLNEILNENFDSRTVKVKHGQTADNITSVYPTQLHVLRLQMDSQQFQICRLGWLGPRNWVYWYVTFVQDDKNTQDSWNLIAFCLLVTDIFEVTATDVKHVKQVGPTGMPWRDLTMKFLIENTPDLFEQTLFVKVQVSFFIAMVISKLTLADRKSETVQVRDIWRRQSTAAIFGHGGFRWPDVYLVIHHPTCTIPTVLLCSFPFHVEPMQKLHNPYRATLFLPVSCWTHAKIAQFLYIWL